jgi:hypothetical protein
MTKHTAGDLITYQGRSEHKLLTNLVIYISILTQLHVFSNLLHYEYELF